jgi:predicted ATP-binding protein involved in virulence
MREVLLTSHSPFIISDCQTENVLVFEKDNDGKVEWHKPEFNTFGASVNAITIKVFGRKETIGDYALSKLEALKKQLDDGVSPDTLIDEAGKELGDSVEKVLFINQALDKKPGA